MVQVINFNPSLTFELTNYQGLKLYIGSVKTNKKMKKIIYLLLVALPLGAMAQNDNEEKITKVQITIEKDGETQTITRELKGGDYDSDVTVFDLDNQDLTKGDMKKVEYLIEHSNTFFLNEMDGEEKEVAFLGVTGHTQAMGSKEVVMLDKIVDGEPAAQAGLLAGDIITNMKGKELADWHSLVEMIHASEIGEEVTLKIERNGKLKSYTIILGSKMTSAGGMMRMKYELTEGDLQVNKLRFFITDELSDVEKSIIRKKTGIVMNDKNTLQQEDINMFPNPTPGKFDFDLTLSEGGPMEIRVFDASGSEITKLSQNSDDGNYKGSFDISNNPPGPYMIVFEKDGKALVEKVLKF